MSEWQPIETAPKAYFDEEIDIWGKGGRFTDCTWGCPTYGQGMGFIYQSGYDCDGHVFSLVPDPTHWMAVPLSPETSCKQD
jgi:hypothetical protein